jgi:hypothetical protein
MDVQYKATKPAATSIDFGIEPIAAEFPGSKRRLHERGRIATVKKGASVPSLATGYKTPSERKMYFQRQKVRGNHASQSDIWHDPVVEIFSNLITLANRRRHRLEANAKAVDGD